ncbi:MAG: hypothetical protein D3923_17030, partial [Candidatus Electrothrix sp. AR3]|nr:hypothetical protein [Candidatus Electrothrix sp. AR3]
MHLAPGNSTIYSYQLTNTGGLTESYSIEVAASEKWADLSTVPDSIELASGASITFDVQITIPLGTTPGSSGVLTIKAQSIANPAITDSLETETLVLVKIAANARGMIVTKNFLNAADLAQFKMTKMTGIGIVAKKNTSTPFDLTFQFGADNAAPIYSFTAESRKLDIAGNRLVYSDTEGNMVRCIFSSKECVINIRHTDFDNTFLGTEYASYHVAFRIA